MGRSALGDFVSLWGMTLVTTKPQSHEQRYLEVQSEH